MRTVSAFPAPAQGAPRVSRAREADGLKLIIQIPCFNEEEVLPELLATLPREVPGVAAVEWLIVDDGSCDRTTEVAGRLGVDHILRLPAHAGLARAFMAGLEHAIALGADIIVNTDADNQYDSSGIPRLIAPILEGRGQIVVGTRPIMSIESFSPFKRFLQRFGSGVVQIVSGTSVVDAPSGFRAFSREAALRLNVFDPYTYTLETLIGAAHSGLDVVSVPASVNPVTRPSRLLRSNLDYVSRSVQAIGRAFLIYRPARSFFLLGLLPAFVALVLAIRWVWLKEAGLGGNHVPSLIAAGVLLLLGILMWTAGLLAELSAINRRLLQDIQYRLRSNGGFGAGSARSSGTPPVARE